MGRIDFQVKIRGFRIEPGEIESVLLNHHFIKEAVVLTHSEDNTGRESNQYLNQYLCAYIVPAKTIKPAEVREFLAEKLPAYMIPSFFVMIEQIPLTTNGKIDKKALPKPEREIGVEAYQAPRNLVEQKLVKIWSDILGRKTGINDNFFHLGGHSIKASLMAARIHRELQVNIPLAELFKNPTIKGISTYIKRDTTQYMFVAIENTEKKQYYPLSSAQERLYVLQQMDKQGIAYNIPTMFRLEGEVDKEKLENTLRKMISRHESLRTSFQLFREKPVQRIQHTVEFHIEFYDPDFFTDINRQESRSHHWAGIETADHSFIRAFDLSCAPLFRVGLIKISGTRYILMLDMHHIISDGISIGVFVKEFAHLYTGGDLPMPRLQYRDFSQWQTSEKTGQSYQEQAKYWQEVFSGDLPVLDLPMDFARPPVQRFTGNTVNFEIPREQTAHIKHMALTEGVTLFMLLLAVYKIFLAKISGQQDIIVGTPTTGRRHADLEPVLGMFVNTLALRSHPVYEKTPMEFLKEVRETVLTAQENQDYPFEEFLEQLSIRRDTSRNPLFDTMFVLQIPVNQGAVLPGLKTEPCVMKRRTSKFDLTLECAEIPAKPSDSLACTFEYSTVLFKEETIQRFSIYFMRVLNAVLQAPHRKIAEIQLISEREKKQILVDFNNTSTSFPADKTIPWLFKQEVEQHPFSTALCSCTNHPVQLTYDYLQERSCHAAQVLKNKGAGPGIVVGIMLERSLSMITALLAILDVGAAYLPIDYKYPFQRIRDMLTDSNAAILVTQTNLLHIPRQISFAGQIIDISGEELFKPIPWKNHEKKFLPPISSDLAYIIYTSGSTGTPKGVMVEHSNVVRLVKNTNYFTFTPGHKLLFTGELAFDITTFEIWGPLLNHLTLCLPDPKDILDTGKIKNILINNNINILHLVPQVFNQLAAQDPDIFGRLSYLLVGGDLVKPGYINVIRKAFPGLQILHMYGPSENTTFSTFYPVKEECKGSLPIGKPLTNSYAYVMDRNNRHLPIGIIGELHVAGSGIAKGYLNNPELTNQKFCRGSRGTVFQKSPPGRRRQNRYKTGDLARWLSGGDLEFHGRSDHQVKIRGIRIETGEIENQLLRHKGIKEAIVIPGPVPGTSGSNSSLLPEEELYLCAYVIFEPGNNIPPEQLRAFLQEKLPEPMIPAFFIRLDHIPLTANGKINRKALPAPTLENRKHYTPPRCEIEKKLQDIWRQVLGKVASSGTQEEVLPGIDDHFFQLGGHSLKASLVVARIHNEFNIKIPLDEFFKNPYIRKLAEYIKRSAITEHEIIPCAEKKEYFGLSPAQKRLYVLQQMEEGITAYNMPQAFRLEGSPDKGKFERIFGEIIHRHESLRTSFHIKENETIQRIHDDVEFEIEYLDSQSAAAHQSSFIRPFDLTRVPLLRVGLIKEGEREHVLLVDMHHIIADGTSTGILITEFMALYSENQLPLLRIQYKDFSGWQNSNRQKSLLNVQEQYWQRQMAGEVPVLFLPTDFPRPALQRFAGDCIVFELEKSETETLKQVALAEQVTIYMLLSAICNVFLAKITGQEDIVIGSPTAGRRHCPQEQIMGMFVNTLAIRSFPNGEKTFNRYLHEVKHTIGNAQENQDYPFEQLVERLAISRDTSRNPLFDVMFALQNLEIPQLEIPGLTLKPYDFATTISKFDLSLYAAEIDGKLSFSLEYSSKLFKRETIERWANYFKIIVSLVNKTGSVKIDEMEIIPEEEKHRVLFIFNNNASDYPASQTLHGLFEKRVEQIPDHTALTGTGPIQLTYSELNHKSNQLACLLRENGVEPDSIVALMVERSVEMIVGILGILKSGAGYLPMDPEYPAERIEYMTADSSAKILVTSGSLEKKAQEIRKNLNIISIDCIDFSLLPGSSSSSSYLFSSLSQSSLPQLLSVPTSHPANLAYIIYTSGSTGRPKGVMVRHRSVVNILGAL